MIESSSLPRHRKLKLKVVNLRIASDPEGHQCRHRIRPDDLGQRRFIRMTADTAPQPDGLAPTSLPPISAEQSAAANHLLEILRSLRPAAAHTPPDLRIQFASGQKAEITARGRFTKRVSSSKHGM